MKIELIDGIKTVMSNPDSLHGYFGWPTVARLKNGRIAVVASGFRLKHVCPFGKTVISYSDDEGETYTAPAPVIDTVLDDRDGGITPFGENGVIVTSFNNTVAFQRDVVSKYGDPILRAYASAYLDTVDPIKAERDYGITFRVSFDGGITFGKLYKSNVSSPHGPMELRDGRILWVGRSSETMRMTEEGIFAYTLDPADGSMQRVGAIPPIVKDGKTLMSCEPHTYEREDGRLICHIRAEISPQNSSHTTYQSVSDDGGVSWSTPVDILDGACGHPAHIIRHSSGVLISTYGFRHAPLGIRAMFSTDGGENWEVGHDIYTNTVSGDLGYPSTVELGDGSLLTVFYAIPEQGSPAVILQQRWRIVD